MGDLLDSLNNVAHEKTMKINHVQESVQKCDRENNGNGVRSSQLIVSAISNVSNTSTTNYTTY